MRMRIISLNEYFRRIAHIVGIEVSQRGHRCPKLWAMNAQTMDSNLGNFVCFNL